MAQKRLLTGLQPSGQLHIGNYFGALKPFVDIYRQYESFLMVADYHALTSLKDPAGLRQNIIDVVKDYLAAGVDQSKTVVFQQSQVLEHTELAWIFDCLVPVSLLELGHAYKDKVAKGLDANVGLFNYPMLMAADILLYDSQVVPVGQDQKQHVEYAREAAAKFNHTYGETFIEPKELVFENAAIVPGTDGQRKMSKSYKNIIPLFGGKDEIAKAVMSIVTDSSPPVSPPASLASTLPIPANNVFAIHKLFKDEAVLTPVYMSHAGNYKALKEMLIEDIETIIEPMRKKREHISDEDVALILKDGSDKARAVASAKMREVRGKIGVSV